MRQLLWLLILSSAVVCKIEVSHFVDPGKERVAAIQTVSSNCRRVGDE
jgi:hypothetical protein